MTAENPFHLPDVPPENQRYGLASIEIPGLPEPRRGKVRDIWDIEFQGEPALIVGTSDRLSAYDEHICLLPPKGEVLTLLTEEWCKITADIVPNHVIAVPHPNILIARKAAQMIPVEMVVRGFMAQSSSSTSVYKAYMEGKREIYGIEFPDGILPNQELPMGPIITPTTKAEKGHDKPLVEEEARELVDGQFGSGTWDQVAAAAHRLYARGRAVCAQKGLILADTKYEFGVDQNGQLMLCDEIHTPDSSRFWHSGSYMRNISAGLPPESFDKELIRRWLAENGFTGEGPVPVLPPELIESAAIAYRRPYEMITGKQLPIVSGDPMSIQQEIYNSVQPYL